MVDGAFDPLHRGHIEYFRAAAAAARRAAAVQRRVGSLRAHEASRRCCPRISAQRSSTPSASSATRTSTSSTPRPILRELQPKYYVKGKDWDGRLPPDQVRICAEHGIEVVYLDTVIDSSSRILKSYTEQIRASDEHHRVRAARHRSEAGGVRPLRFRVLHRRLARRGEQLQPRDTPADRGEEPVADQGRVSAEEGARPRMRPRRVDAPAVGARRRRRRDRLRREQQAAGDAAGARPHHRRLRRRPGAEAGQRATTWSSAARCSSTSRCCR